MPISKHEEKMVNLRVQMQQNQSELHDYLADLNNWEKDIKQKEEHLTAVKTVQKQELPPVRNSIQKKKMKKKRKEKKVTDSAKDKRISGFDFKAWDKFDVDKALEEVDKKGDETSSSDYETDEEWEMERKKHLAGLEKDKGNEFLKNGKYDEAVESYSRGIDFDATNAVLPANRAMVFLKQQKFASAELDCTVSISLDPMYVKAYLRRATARTGMLKFDEAIADYNRVLDLEPSNKQAQSEIERLQKELKRDKDVPVTSTLTEKGKGIVKPIYKQPEDRSKAPLRRINIEEIGIESIGQKPPVNLAHGPAAKIITAREEENFGKLVSQSMLQQPISATTSSANEISSPSVSAGSRLEAVNLISRESDSPQQQEDNKLSLDSKIGNHDFSKSFIPSNVLKTQKRPSWNAASNIESNLIQPPASEHSQRNSSAIPPTHYPQLFGQCLDADILMVILKSLAEYCEKYGQDLYEVLYQLSQVKRFSMTAMFLSQKDKQVARGLMEQMTKSGVRPQNDILSLSRAYEL
uniref:RNA polymerase II-associated protein 3 n=1 Tax=Arion vulgaris TaxID=1028688 RepID=A0A0B7ALH0_9EUPU